MAETLAPATDNSSTDILVIGAGIVGLAIAMEMLHRGKTVRIIDKDFYGPIRTHIGELSFFSGDPVLANLTRLSREAWQAADSRYGITTGLTTRGGLELATTPGRKVVLQNEVADDPQQFSLLLSVEAIAERLGTPLAPEVTSARYEENAPILSTHTALAALREKITQAGAIIWGTDEVVEFVLEENEATTTLKGARVRSGEVALASEVFLAAGSLTSKLLNSLHLSLPLRPSRQHLATFTLPEGMAEPMITHRLRRGHLTFKRLQGGNVMMAYDGLMDPTQATYSTVPDVALIESLRTYAAEKLLPAFLHAAPTETTAVTAAVTPDFRPVIGRWRGVQGLWLATGFAGRSYAYAMVVAQTLGQIILGEMPARLNIAPFAPDRFELDRWPRFQRPPSLAWSEQATFSERTRFADNVQTTGSGPAEFMDNVAMVDKHKVQIGTPKTEVREVGGKGKIQMAGARSKVGG